ncbi:MAG: Na+/H+ antiporter subunit [Cypionkella sp.]|uniref:cation:proton antiporter n=1 Tax=Cypionkella sp. TaxID=2811411 RepID=UPI00260BB6EE|nr:monovalent cation/H(+) antiporter subunit G [Cypionkella sp.]MDB5660997.1 Na+/H+ antiporter subunit [Cypionkella sp.]
MNVVIDLVISGVLAVGGLFGLIGSFGMLKLREPMQRLHAPTEATTVGVGAILIAATVIGWQNGIANWHGVLITIFLLVTAPMSALMLAKAHRHLAQPKLPDTGTDAQWASDPPPRDDSD